MEYTYFITTGFPKHQVMTQYWSAQTKRQAEKKKKPQMSGFLFGI